MDNTAKAVLENMMLDEVVEREEFGGRGLVMISWVLATPPHMSFAAAENYWYLSRYIVWKELLFCSKSDNHKSNIHLPRDSHALL